MDDLIKLVRTYRLTAGLADRERLADAIFAVIEPAMRLFVNGKIRPQYADDVLQEVLKAIVISLPKFTGDDVLKWCRGVARHKIYDQYKINTKTGERFQALPPEEIWELVDLSAAAEPLTVADRLDLDYAMKMLAASKPECQEFLWRHIGLEEDYGTIGEDHDMSYDAVRMQTGRCLETVRELVA
ncbi:MAG: sigma-70 family RNA polymerase sigma factor [Verrucomicrobia bacterium]|nr:MAG: sigma-70 family RNA polymerase sigma factor [Verrucomicrobiota bacterium]